MKKYTEVKDELTWWLSKKGFILNGEFRIDLLFIDRVNNSCKIKITNIKDSQDSIDVEVNNDR